MSLYYLKGSETQRQTSDQDLGSSTPSGRLGGILLIITGSLIILGGAILQAVFPALFLTWESKLTGVLPASWRPTLPKMVLLTMAEEPKEFSPLDLAMSLRGLGKLHPAHVLVHGPIAAVPANEPIPLLQGLLSRLRDEGMEIILPQKPSSDALWHSLPLCCYEPPAALRLKAAWPLAHGKATPSGKETFLPTIGGSANTLPLLATTDEGEIIGSLWWKAVTSFTHASPTGPIWLLGKRILILPNHAVIFLNEYGAIERESSLPSVDIRMVPLADFLLKLEQRERGTLSPDFDAIWDNSTVVIGTPSDLPRVTLLASLQSRLTLRALPLLLQAVLMILWIILLAAGYRLARNPRLIAAVILMFLTLCSSLLALRDGWLLPYLPPLLTSLLLLIPFPVFRVSR